MGVNIFLNNIYDKELITRIYKQYNNHKTDNPTEKWERISSKHMFNMISY